MRKSHGLWLLALASVVVLAAWLVWRALGSGPALSPTAGMPMQRPGSEWSAAAPQPVAEVPMGGAAPFASALATGVDQQAPAWLKEPPSSATQARLNPELDQAPKRSQTSERVSRRAEIQALLQGYQAKGKDATLADANALLAELEKITAGSPHSDYLAQTRQSIVYIAQAQALSEELQRLQPIDTPEGVARQQVILAELRSLSQRITVASTNTLQAVEQLQSKEPR